MPRAFINYIIFDNNFQVTAYGADPVFDITKPNYGAGAVKDYTGEAPLHNISVPADGYIYVYCSNESPNTPVYFDNLQVVDTRGPLVEENQYYPVGLQMAGISSRALNFAGGTNYYRYQGKEMQDNEFSDGSGLQEYDFAARYYDQQLGVWHTPDPANQFASPYVGMGNNWPNGVDPSGKWAWWDDVVVSGIGFITGFLESAISDHKASIGHDILAGLISAGEAEAMYLGMGGGLNYDHGISFAGGVWSTGVPFSASFAATSTFTFVQNYQQLENASSGKQLGLIAGYNATSAISAGFNSNNAQGWVDGWFKGGINDWFAGALSQGLGGAISNFGNSILQNGGGVTPGAVFSAASGFASSYAAQFAHNAVGQIGFLNKGKNSNGQFKPFSFRGITKSLFENITSGATQQFVGNFLNERATGDYHIQGVDNPYLGQYFIGGTSWWGAYLNGLGGFPADVYNDSH